MKSSLLLLSALLILVMACSKDKLTTEPKVTVKSISPTVVFKNDIISIKSKYTDLEGDIDSVFVVYRWYNGATILTRDTFRFSFTSLGVPAKTQEADLNVYFQYNSFNNPELPTISGVPRDTTATFGLQLKDKDGHKSNFSESEKIRLKF